MKMLKIEIHENWSLQCLKSIIIPLQVQLYDVGG